MGNTDSTQRLGERVLTGKRKLDQDTTAQSARYEYLVTESPNILDVMIKSVIVSFESCSPFLEATLLIAWKHDQKTVKKTVLETCRKVLGAPIESDEYSWFKQYVFPSSLWLFRTHAGAYMYEELLQISKNMSLDIINSMDKIYKHLLKHSEWDQVKAITNRASILRQDHGTVGLLNEKAFKDIFEGKSDIHGKVDEMRTFIDSNLAINILTSTAKNINHEFQTHIKKVMSRYGDFKPGPIKKVERCVSKLENDYQNAQWPKCAKLLDLVRCSVTFNTVDQLIEGHKHLMDHMSRNQSTIELSRIKNMFLDQTINGYRDIKVNVVYKSVISPGMNMICEIQLMLINYLQEKKRIHKLYSIVREEIYFEMVTKPLDDEKTMDITDLGFHDFLNVKDVEIGGPDGVNKCSVDSELGLLALEGIGFLGVVDIHEKKAITTMKRDAPGYPWYGRQTHQWMTINEERYLSVQMGRTQIKMFKLIKDKEKGYVFEADERFTISHPTTINYCAFDRKFESILLIVNDSELQKRSIANVSQVGIRIKLEEQINQSSFRNFSLTDDGNLCALGGGANKNYFYVIDIEKREQYKMTSNVLSDTYAPCFISGENEYISVSDKKGMIEIWNIPKKKAIKSLYIGEKVWVTSSASTGNILAIASWDKKLRLFEVHNWECFYVKQYNTKATALHLTPDLKYLTLGGTGGDRCIVINIQSSITPN